MTKSPTGWVDPMTAQDWANHAAWSDALRRRTEQVAVEAKNRPVAPPRETGPVPPAPERAKIIRRPFKMARRKR